MKHPAGDINSDHPMVRWLPKGWWPYAALMRMDRPTGTCLAFLPALMGLHLAIDGQNIDPVSYFRLCAILLAGAFVMRSAGCICNDYFDRDIDPKVARTAARPLASGQLTSYQALSMLLMLAVIALGLLLLLPARCWWAALFIVPMVVVYPLLKRFFAAPQLGLGLVFTTGVWIGWLSLDSGQDWPLPMLLYLSCICWTIGYDTAYALQDRDDDIDLGVQSLAVTAGRHVAAVIVACYILAATLYVALIITTADRALLPTEMRLLFFGGTSLAFMLFTCRNYRIFSFEKGYLRGLLQFFPGFATRGNLLTARANDWVARNAEGEKYRHAMFFRANAWLGLGLCLAIL